MNNPSRPSTRTLQACAAAALALIAGGALLSRFDAGFGEWRRETQVRALDRSRKEQVQRIAARLPADAKQILSAASQGFVTVPRLKDEEFEGSRKEEPTPRASPFMGASTAKALTPQDGLLRVEVPASAPRAAATWVAVEGPRMKVRAEDRGAVGVLAEPIGADQSVKPALVDGYVVYPSVFPAQPGVSLLRRVNDEGAEDYFVYPARPGAEELSYRIALDPGVAGLHQVEGTNTLELLAADGTPRLRVNPPSGMDADGRIFPVTLAVDGCTVDTNPALPWDHAPVDPGARTCMLHLRWSTSRYPATIDPSFVATGSMSKGRFSHSTATVGNGRVLAFGASYSAGDTSAEIYDFATGTWAAAPPVPFVPTPGAGYHSQLHFPDGRPMALEYNGGKQVAAYNGSTNTWAVVGTMPTVLLASTAADAAVQLQNGDILTYNGSKFTASTGTWSTVPSVPSGGAGFFVAYGNTLAMWSNNGSAYRFDTSTNAYTALPSVPFSTGYGGAVLLTDGRVLVSGQYPSTGKCAIYTPANNAWTGCANQNTHQIIEDGVATLPTGAFYVGVDFQGTTLGKAETYNTSTNTWTVNPLPYAAADFPAVTSLPDGRILLSGGMTQQDSSVGFTSAATFGCTSNTDCSAGSVCVITSGTVGSCKSSCTSDAQCGGSLPACNTTSNACVQCTATNSSQCTGSKPFCDTGTNLCTADSSVISVTSPKGGEQWSLGSTQTITWTASGTSSVGIDLYKAGLLVSHIVASTSASAGSYSWSIPAGTTAGTDYKVNIFNPGGTTSSFSAANFSIGTFSTPTTTALSSSVASPVYGNAVSFTATLSPSTATGSVQFSVDGAAFGSAVAVSGGAATSGSTSSLAVGSHTITAVFTGTGSFTASSASMTLTVGQASTTVTLAIAPAAPVYGQPVSLTATVAGPGTAPTGTVGFFDGSTSLGTATLSGGAATLSSSSLATGSHSISAVYQGDANYLGGTGAASVTVSQAATATALATSPNPSAYGNAVTLSAAVSAVAPGAGAPSGTVTFFDGSTNLGSSALSGGGATLTVSSLAVGSHSLTAVYGGDANFLGSTSPSAGQTVNQATPAVALSASPTSPVHGQSVTLTVGVAGAHPGMAVPTGTVTIHDGTAVLAVVTLDATGTGTFSTASLAVGTHTLNGVYGGDANYAGGAASAPYSLTVSQAGSTLTLTSNAASPVFGQPVTYTATVAPVSPGAGTATGTVTFTRETGAVLGTATLDASGAATLTDATLSTGTHTVTAVYAGDANFLSSSGSVTETVGISATTTALAVSPNPSTYGTAATFVATVSPVAPGTGVPTGSVTFFDGATALGTAALSGGSASLSVNLPAGSHGVTAAYSGDGSFSSSSTAAPQTLVVNRAATAATLSAAPATSVTGQQISVTIAVSSPAGVPSGQVSLYDGATSGTPIGTATLAAGTATLNTSFAHAATHPLTAVYGGDANYLGSSAAGGFVVTPAATAVALTASPSQTFVNRPITFQALVTTTAPGAGTPPGTVTFADAGSTLGTATLDASGAASLTVSSMAFGNHPITASYAGNADFQPSQGTLSGGEQVQKSAPVAGSGTAVTFDGATQAATAANADGALDGAHTVEVSFNRAAADVPGAAACLVQQGAGSATVIGLCLTAARDGLEIRRGSDVHPVAVDLGAGWHHVAAVGSDATVLYVDGVQVASISGGFGTAHAQPVVLGAAPGASGNTNRFAGTLDEVRFWSTPRAASDVQADRQRPVASDAAALLALWRMDEGAGSALYDAASHHAVATFEGTPSFVASTAWANRTTPQERPLAAFTDGYDPDGAPVTATVTTAAAHGAATASAAQVGYTPAANFLGTDSFTVSVSNGQSSSNLFTTNVAVTHIDVCKVQSDCGGGDLCTDSRCVGPATFVAQSGGCSSLPSSGPSAALLPLVLVGFLILRRRSRALSPQKASRLGRGAALLVVLLGAGQARAAGGFALDTYEPSPAGDHFFEVPDADVQGHLTPAFGFQAGWAHQPLTLYSNGAPVDQGRLVRDQLAVRLGAAVPLFDRVLLDADVAMSAYQSGQMPFNGQQSLTATAFHDPRIGARVALLRGDLLSVAAGLSLFVPIGSQSGYGSDGSFRALPQVLASGRRGQLVYAGELGIEARKSADVSFTRTGSAMRVGVAGGWLFMNDRLQVGPELFSRLLLSDPSQRSLEALLGARYQRGDFAFGLAAGGRLTQHAPGAAPARVMAQLTFTGLDFLHARDRDARARQSLASARPAPVIVAAPPPPPPAPVVVVAQVAPPAPVAIPVAPPAPVVSLHAGRVELRHTLNFAHDSTVLDGDSREELSEVAELLRSHPEIKRVFIAGHSDDVGGASYNDRLTARRAKAVRMHLELHGIPGRILEARGCGSRGPVASNATEEGRALNRRVDILVPETKEKPGCGPLR